MEEHQSGEYLVKNIIRISSFPPFLPQLSLMRVQMLNCISGMVEKTQRAISILQQRQAEAGSARSAEELVADIQARASSALMEVKLAALEEIRAAKQGAADTAQPGQQSKNKDEVRLYT